MAITSIRTKLLLVLVPLFVVSFAILAGISYYLSSQALQESAASLALAVGSDYSQRMQADIEERLTHLEDLAHTKRIMEATDKEQMVVALAEFKNRIGDFYSVIFIAADGNSIDFSGRQGYDGDRDFFKQALATKQPYVSEPSVSRITGKLAVYLVTPVVNNGQFVGVIVGAYSLDHLSDSLSSLKFLDTGFGFLADKEGLVIGHPKNPEFVGKLNLADTKVNEDLKGKMQALDAQLVNLFKSAAASDKAVVGNYNRFDGSRQVVVLTPIELPGNRWVLTIAAPEAEATRTVSVLARTMVIVSVVFIILAIIFILIMSKRFAKPIAIIRDECLRLTQGDFRERANAVDSADEIGQLARGFQEMKTNVSGLVAQVQRQSEQVAASSEELTASAHQSAEASNQVAASVTDIAAGTQRLSVSAGNIAAVAEELSASTEYISSSAGKVAAIAGDTSAAAEQGRQAVKQAIGQMQIIGQGSAAVETAIAELAQGSAEIREIVELISSIAGQTNLLALNAAIEAARAGENGRGFAVVAEEVRKLAEESNKAAQGIGALIQRNQSNMEQAVSVTQAGAEGIKAGIEVVNSTGAAFEQIVAAITKLSEQIKEISVSIKEMASGSTTLVSAIQEVDKVSQETAGETQTVSAATEEQSASMEEIAAASQGLAKMAEDLQAAVAKFQV